jgi:hypothetical protein
MVSWGRALCPTYRYWHAGALRKGVVIARTMTILTRLLFLVVTIMIFVLEEPQPPYEDT